ncbi:MAG: polysaccharide pyruvyl transferase family protein [Phycisphaerae bacterium]|nr:polysaccharide pyruvyl transferase family protein [Phycisphaerae bacterium]MDD5381697.1 polysaccharide pyruvyl transferase family protein [Phycisphaerae bacterium]
MKIGILTFHDGINYGAFFQVYSLQSFLLQHGFDCQVINYKSPGFTKREYRVFLKLRRPVYFVRNVRKIIQFKKAHKKLRLTKRIFTLKGLSKLLFGRIIIGSDEVWNFSTRLIGYDPVYFSQGLQAERIISYGASFGSIKANQPVPEQLKEALGRIAHISVRDDNSADIMRVISDKPVRIVLDPTFLVDLSSEAVLPREKGFILVYGSFSSKMVRKIVEYARFVGRKTISVGYRLPWCDVSLDTLSPFQWLGYFAAADCVITTMFHGMIYSILNQKEFCMFITPYRQNKLGNFPSDIKLSERIVDENVSLKDVFSRKIDYSQVNSILQTKRNDSAKFLLEAL